MDIFVHYFIVIFVEIEMKKFFSIQNENQYGRSIFAAAASAATTQGVWSVCYTVWSRNSVLGVDVENEIKRTSILYERNNIMCISCVAWRGYCS